jgi:opacity protein-like surface antigen
MVWPRPKSGDYWERLNENPCGLLRPGDSLFGFAEVVSGTNWNRFGSVMQMIGKLTVANVVTAGALATALCAPANAADLSRRPYAKAPAPLMQPIYNWTGFYVGANFGGVATNETVTAGGLAAFSTDPSGVLGGVQVGYNYQFSPNWLVGVEGELAWTSASSTNSFGVLRNAGSFSSNHNWYDTLDGRVGYVMGPWLLYAKAGIAWMNADYQVTLGGIGSNSINTTRVGWNIGAGAEFMIAPQWSAKAEYNFLDFGTDTYGFAIPIVGGGTPINTQVHEFKVGVNYHLAPGTLFGRW